MPKGRYRPSRVLIVEDDIKTSETVALYLRHAGYEVLQVFDGAAAPDKAASFEPDLVILDLMLPGTSGLELCAGLRAQSDVPIVMLTARTTEIDRLRGLDAGADDYVCKPFSPRELAARVRAILRRGPERDERVHCGAFTVDSGSHEAAVGGAPLSLTVTEFRILFSLCRANGKVRTREDLISEVFGVEYAGTERAVDVHVRNLRKKIVEAGGPPDSIRTIFGVGYKMSANA